MWSCSVVIGYTKYKWKKRSDILTPVTAVFTSYAAAHCRLLGFVFSYYTCPNVPSYYHQANCSLASFNSMHAHMILNILLRRKKVGFNATIRENRIIVNRYHHKARDSGWTGKTRRGGGIWRSYLILLMTLKKLSIAFTDHRLASLAITSIR